MLEPQPGTPAKTANDDIQFTPATYDFDDLNAAGVQASNSDLAALAAAIDQLATPDIAPPPPRIAEAVSHAAPLADALFQPSSADEERSSHSSSTQPSSSPDWHALTLALERSLQDEPAPAKPELPSIAMKDDGNAPPAVPATAFNSDNRPDWHALAASLSLDPLTNTPASSGHAAAEQAQPLPSAAYASSALADAVVAGATSSDRKSAAQPQIYHFKFTGNGSEYFRIWIVNLALTILTLGIYSAWAKVRTTRYFYGCTRLAGSSFQYLADPVAILRGRLLAVLVLGLLALCFSANQLLAAVATIIALGLGPWLVIGAMVFKLRNSAWRGCRFDFLGHYREGLWAVSSAYLINSATAGLAYPWWFQRLKRYLINNTAIGGDQFHVELSAGPFYAIAVRAVLALAGVVVVTGLIVNWLPFLALAAAFLLLATATYVYAYWRAHSRNLVFNAMTLDDGQFYSDLQVDRLFWIYVLNGTLMLLTLGLAWPWTQVRLARYYASCTELVHKDLDGMVVMSSNNNKALGSEALDLLSFELGF